MKILFLTHSFPYPLNDGVRLHVYYILKELAARHEIFLFSLNDSAVSAQDLQAIRDLGVHVEKVIHHKVPQGAARRIFSTLFKTTPFCVEQFWSTELKQALKLFLRRQVVDVAHIDYISMAPYIDLLGKLPKIFFPHDAISMLFERNVESERRLDRKIYTYLQWKKIQHFESVWTRRFDSTMVVSPVDKTYLEQHCLNVKIAVSPNGVDTAYFCPQNIAQEEALLVFRGVMNFQPNADAARYFYQDIFPLIRKQIPQARFMIVGQMPPADIVEWTKTDQQVTCTGFVEDIRLPMAQATLLVSPMRIGSGIKNKILEPMAMGKTIVATSMSCAGLEAVNGQHLYLEDTPDGFANTVVKLLRQVKEREQTGQQARQFVEQHYTWAKNARDFEALYLQAVQNKK